jgi:hypothetical protein
MNWKEWSYWNEKKYLAAIFFAIVYVLTIPIRNYDFLNKFIDTGQGVPIVAHLIIIVIGAIFIIILLSMIDMIVKRFSS